MNLVQAGIKYYGPYFSPAVEPRFRRIELLFIYGYTLALAIISTLPVLITTRRLGIFCAIAMFVVHSTALSSLVNAGSSEMTWGRETHPFAVFSAMACTLILTAIALAISAHFTGWPPLN